MDFEFFLDLMKILKFRQVHNGLQPSVPIMLKAPLFFLGH